VAIIFKTKTPAPPVGIAVTPGTPAAGLAQSALTVELAMEVLATPVFPPDSIYPAEYTILIALDEWALRATKGETLMLVNKETGEGYQVLGFDKLSGKAKLKNNQGAMLNPKIGIREAGQYTAVWR
jgi:hypothetical protein